MKKTIFITGASSGLGKATAKLFAENDWIVIATMRNPENETEFVQYPNVHLLKLDITDPTQVTETVAKAEQISPIGVLFNNAGYVLAASLEATSETQMQAQFNTNFFGTIRLTKAVLPHLRARKKGIILTTTSLGAYIPDPFMSLYAASKSALETWSAAMSYELDRYNIQMKTIIPGFMQTNFVNNAQMVKFDAYEEDWNKVLAAYAVPNENAIIDQPEDIAAVVLEAATDDIKQLHYFAGKDATTRHKDLESAGIDAIIKDRKTSFLGD